MDVVPYLLLAAMVVVIFYARKRGRQKLDAEFRAALAMLNIDQYELLVDSIRPAKSSTQSLVTMVAPRPIQPIGRPTHLGCMPVVGLRRR